VAQIQSRLFAAIALAVVLVAALGVRLLTDKGHAAAVEIGKPAEVSTGDLRSFAHGRVVYWAGPASAMKLELTQTRGGVFVRYLPKNVRVGDKRALFTTVATYRVPGAYEIAIRSHRRSAMVTRHGPDGYVVTWSKARPTSVYVATRGSPSLVEVFDPSAARARALVFSGQILRVR
jgi:hypothetical protein